MGPGYIRGVYNSKIVNGELAVHFSTKDGIVSALVAFYHPEETEGSLETVAVATRKYKWRSEIAEKLSKYDHFTMLDQAKIFLSDVAVVMNGVSLEVSWVEHDWYRWDFTDLFEEFNRDIIYDAHGFMIRFCGSWAMREINRRGRDSLRPIIEHLKTHPYSDEELSLA